MCVLRPNEDFYRQFGSVMMRRYGNVSGSLPKTAAEAFAAGLKPSFQEFITYLLDPETERESIFNEHWRQVFVSHKREASFNAVRHYFWDDWFSWDHFNFLMIICRFLYTTVILQSVHSVLMLTLHCFGSYTWNECINCSNKNKF